MLAHRDSVTGRATALRFWTRSAALRYGMRRVLGTSAQSLEQAAVRKDVLCPSELRMVMPPRLSNEHAARVRRCALDEPVEGTLAKLLSPVQYDMPTVAYRLHAAMLDGKFLYSGMFKHDLARCDPVQGSDFEWMETAVLTSTFAGTQWFGHFLHDELPSQLAAEMLAPLIGHARAPYLQEPGYRELFDLPRPSTVRRAFVEECILLHDVGLNSHKRARLDRMRERARRSGGGPQRIYFQRRDGHSRTLVNEERLVERLVTEGFTVVTPGDLDVKTLAQVCGAARIVVGVDGSHLYAPLLLLPPRAEVLVIMPPLRLATAGLQIAQAMDFNVSLFVAEVAATKETFSVQEDEFLRFVAQSRN
ncbi:MAG TPA: glycosyltransferase family 61 protein [Planctomycetota bacterium]|nr:glycosyltransferase family 61 protein [Planctomycetota bacterium]